MANPYKRAAPATWPLGPSQSTDNFSGLASGAAKALGIVSPGTISAPLANLIIPVWKITLASSPTTGGTISRYLLYSEDGTLWPGGLSATSTADQHAALAAAISADAGGGVAGSFQTGALLDVITVQSGTTVYQPRWLPLRGLVGDLAS